MNLIEKMQKRSNEVAEKLDVFNQTQTQVEPNPRAKKETRVSAIFYLEQGKMIRHLDAFNSLQTTTIDGQVNINCRFYKIHFPGHTLLKADECTFQYGQIRGDHLTILSQRVDNFFGNITGLQSLLIGGNIDNRNGVIRAPQVSLIALPTTPPNGSLIDNSGGVILADAGTLYIQHQMLINELGHLWSDDDLYLLLGVLCNIGGGIITREHFCIRLAMANNLGGTILGGKGGEIHHLQTPKHPQSYSSRNDNGLFELKKVIEATQTDLWHIFQKETSSTQLDPLYQELLNKIGKLQSIAPAMQKGKEMPRTITQGNKVGATFGDRIYFDLRYREFLNRTLHTFTFNELFTHALQRVELVGLVEINLYGRSYSIPGDLLMQVQNLLGDKAFIDVGGSATLEIGPSHIKDFEIVAQKILNLLLKNVSMEQSHLEGASVQMATEGEVELNSTSVRSSHKDLVVNPLGQLTVGPESIFVSKNELLIEQKTAAVQVTIDKAHLAAAKALKVDLKGSYTTTKGTQIDSGGDYSLTSDQFDLNEQSVVDGRTTTHARKLGTLQGVALARRGHQHSSDGDLALAHAALYSTHGGALVTAERQLTTTATIVEVTSEIGLFSRGSQTHQELEATSKEECLLIYSQEETTVISSQCTAPKGVQVAGASFTGAHNIIKAPEGKVELNGTSKNGSMSSVDSYYRGEKGVEISGFEKEDLEENQFHSSTKVLHNVQDSQWGPGNSWSAPGVETKSHTQTITGFDNCATVEKISCQNDKLNLINGQFCVQGAMEVQTPSGEQKGFNLAVTQNFSVAGGSFEQLHSTTTASNQKYEVQNYTSQYSICQATDKFISIYTLGGSSHLSRSEFQAGEEIIFSGDRSTWGSEIRFITPTLSQWAAHATLTGEKQIFDVERCSFKNKQLDLLDGSGVCFGDIWVDGTHHIQNNYNLISNRDTQVAVDIFSMENSLLSAHRQKIKSSLFTGTGSTLEAVAGALALTANTIKSQSTWMLALEKVELKGGMATLEKTNLTSLQNEVEVTMTEQLQLDTQNRFTSATSVNLTGTHQLAMTGEQVFHTPIALLEAPQGDVKGDKTILLSSNTLTVSAAHDIHLNQGAIAANQLNMQSPSLHLIQQQVEVDHLSMKPPKEFFSNESELQTNHLDEIITQKAQITETLFRVQQGPLALSAEELAITDSQMQSQGVMTQQGEQIKITGSLLEGSQGINVRGDEVQITQSHLNGGKKGVNTSSTISTSISDSECKGAQAINLQSQGCQTLSQATLTSLTSVQIDSESSTTLSKNEITAPSIGVSGLGTLSIEKSALQGSIHFLGRGVGTLFRSIQSFLTGPQITTEKFKETLIQESEVHGNQVLVKGSPDERSDVNLIQSAMRAEDLLRIEVNSLTNRDSAAFSKNKMELPIDHLDNRGVFLAGELAMTQLQEDSVNRGILAGKIKNEIRGSGVLEQEGTLAGKQVQVELKDLRESSHSTLIAAIADIKTDSPYVYNGQSYLINELLKLQNERTKFQQNLTLRGIIDATGRDGIENNASVASQLGMTLATHGEIDGTHGRFMSRHYLNLISQKGVTGAVCATDKTLRIVSRENKNANKGIWLADKLQMEGSVHNDASGLENPPVTYANRIETGPGIWEEGGVVYARDEMDASKLTSMEVGPGGEMYSLRKLNLSPQEYLVNKGLLVTPELAVKCKKPEDLGEIDTPNFTGTVAQGPWKLDSKQSRAQKIACEVLQGDLIVTGTLASHLISLRAPQGKVQVDLEGVVGAQTHLEMKGKVIDNQGKIFSGGSAELRAALQVYFQKGSQFAAFGNVTVVSGLGWILHGAQAQVGGELIANTPLNIYPHLPMRMLPNHADWQSYLTATKNCPGNYILNGGPNGSLLPSTHSFLKKRKKGNSTSGITESSLLVGGNHTLTGNLHIWGGKMIVGNYFHHQGTAWNNHLVHHYIQETKKKKACGTKTTFIHTPRDQILAYSQILSRGGMTSVGLNFFNGGDVYGKNISVSIRNFQNKQQCIWGGDNMPKAYPKLIDLAHELEKLGIDSPHDAQGQKAFEQLHEEMRQIAEKQFTRETANFVAQDMLLDVVEVLHNTGIIKGEQIATIRANQIINDKPEKKEIEVGTQYKSCGRKKKHNVVLTQAGVGGEIIAGTELRMEADKYSSYGGRAYGGQHVNLKIKDLSMDAFRQEFLNHMAPGRRGRISGAQGYSIRPEFLAAGIYSDGTLWYEGDRLIQKGGQLLSQGDLYAKLTEKSEHLARNESFVRENKKGMGHRIKREEAVFEGSIFGSTGGNTFLQTGKGGIYSVGSNFISSQISSLTLMTAGNATFKMAEQQLHHKFSSLKFAGIGVEYNKTSMTTTEAVPSQLIGGNVSVIAEGKIRGEGLLASATGTLLFDGAEGVEMVAKALFNQMKQRGFTISASFFMSNALLKIIQGAPASEVLNAAAHEHGIPGALWDVFSSQSSGEAICKTMLAAIKIEGLAAGLANAYQAGGIPSLNKALMNQLGITDSNGKFDPKFTVRVGYSQQETQWNEQKGSHLQAQNIQMRSSRGKVKIEGSSAQAANDMDIYGNKGVEIGAAEETRTSKGFGVGVSASFAVGQGGLGAGVDGSVNSSSSSRQVLSQLSAGNNMTILSDEEMRIRGAQLAAGNTVTLDSQGDMELTSLLDTHKSQATGFNANFSATCISGGFNHSKTDEKVVNNRTTVQANRRIIRTRGTLSLNGVDRVNAQGEEGGEEILDAANIRYGEIRQERMQRQVALQGSLELNKAGCTNKGIPAWVALSKADQKQLTLLRNQATNGLVEQVTVTNKKSSMGVALPWVNTQNLSREWGDITSVTKAVLAPVPDQIADDPTKIAAYRVLLARQYPSEQVLESLDSFNNGLSMEQMPGMVQGILLDDADRHMKALTEEMRREKYWEETEKELSSMQSQADQEVEKEWAEVLLPQGTTFEESVDLIEKQDSSAMKAEFNSSTQLPTAIDPVDDFFDEIQPLEEDYASEIEQEVAELPTLIAASTEATKRTFGKRIFSDWIEEELFRLLGNNYTPEMLAERRLVVKTYQTLARHMADLKELRAQMESASLGQRLANMGLILELQAAIDALTTSLLNRADASKFPRDFYAQKLSIDPAISHVAHFTSQNKILQLTNLGKDGRQIEGMDKIGTRKAIVNGKPQTIVLVTGIKNTRANAHEALKAIQQRFGDDVEIHLCYFDMGVGEPGKQFLEQPTEQVEFLAEQIKTLMPTNEGEIVFIAHSMGGKLISQALSGFESQRNRISVYTVGSAEITDNKYARRMMHFFSNADHVVRHIPGQSYRIDLAVALHGLTEEQVAVKIRDLAMKKYSDARNPGQEIYLENAQTEAQIHQYEKDLYDTHALNEKEGVKIVLSNDLLSHGIMTAPYQEGMEQITDEILDRPNKNKKE